MDTKKTVSVVMCTYNGERFLREQMDSILAQTYPIAEIIVQDDCSTDGTVGILREYAAKCPEIKLFQNEHNLGYNLNFRTAVMRATGDFVALADQDDVWFSRKIERLVEGIGEHSICFSDVLRGKDMAHAATLKYKYNVENNLFRPILGHTMLLKREFVQEESHWIKNWPYDWGLALMAHIDGNGIGNVPELLVFHREHDEEVSNRGKAKRSKPSLIKPYLCGWSDYRRIQQSSRWQALYGSLLEQEGLKRHPLAYNLTRLVVSTRLSDLLRLCFLCMKHKEKVYPGNAKGLKGCLRGFFFPSIYAYYNKGEFV